MLLDGIPLNSAMEVLLTECNKPRPDKRNRGLQGITPSELRNATGGDQPQKQGSTVAGFHASAAISAYGYRKFSARQTTHFSNQFRLFGFSTISHRTTTGPI